jgi:hypothetical protein
MMNRKAIPTQVDQADQTRWKERFEGSLSRLNGAAVPASQQPILRSRRDRPDAIEGVASKTAIADAAISLAALWQISPKRHGL